MKNACEWGSQKAMATTKAIHEFQMNLQHFNNTRSFARIGMCVCTHSETQLILFIHLFN